MPSAYLFDRLLYNDINLKCLLIHSFVLEGAPVDQYQIGFTCANCLQVHFLQFFRTKVRACGRKLWFPIRLEYGLVVEANFPNVACRWIGLEDNLQNVANLQSYRLINL